MYTENQWKKLAESFNSKKFLGKLMLIKQHPTIFKLEEDNSWFMLRLHCEDAMENEWDLLFEFPGELSSSNIRDLFWSADVKLY
tara:strand:- start:384 stop:635 length:252 start_codon:yes stop_codon:yes gene_type:complete